jgi:hypothetical protein
MEQKSRYELFLDEERERNCPDRLGRIIKKCNELAAIRDAQDRADGSKDRATRFWKFYHTHTQLSNGCLEWTGCYIGRNREQPAYEWEGRVKNVRRIVYQLSMGEIFDGEIISTSCRNSRCVRHSHLKKLTREEFDILLRNSAPVGDKHGKRKRHRDNQ